MASSFSDGFQLKKEVTISASVSYSDIHKQPSIGKRASTIMVMQTIQFFEDDYVLVDPLGEPGSFGVAYSCYKRSDENKTLFAVKKITKAKFYHLERESRYEILGNMQNEINVMKSMNHKYIVNLHEVYEDRNYIYLVMDYLTGGELFQRITAADSMTETDAATITKQILQALSYMQANDIAHLDLKPDNIMFANADKDSPIKLIDFGMSRVVPRLKKMNQIVGTPYYTAPEILKGEYDRSADVWSVGVIVFCMLFGYPPFYIDSSTLTYGKKEEDAIYEAVSKGFTAKVLPGYGAWFPEDIPISANAMSFLERILKTKVAERMTVSEALSHPWLRGEAATHSLPRTVFDALTSFNQTNKFKALISRIFAQKLDPTRYAQTLEVFKKWDTDGDGAITLEEFKKGLNETTDLSDEQIRKIFENIDVDNSKSITIDELVISAAMDALVSVDERMYEAFCLLDTDGDGSITIDELKQVIHAMNGGKNEQEIEDIDAIIAEIDLNGDGSIDYEEFLHALHPQYNEMSTTEAPDLNSLRSVGFATFDAEQFRNFQQFIRGCDSETQLQYHFQPKRMRSNFAQFQQSQLKQNTMDVLPEEDDDDDDEDDDLSADLELENEMGAAHTEQKTEIAANPSFVAHSGGGHTKVESGEPIILATEDESEQTPQQNESKVKATLECCDCCRSQNTSVFCAIL